MKQNTSQSGPAAALSAALAYLSRGWSVIPLAPRGKTPLVRWQEFQNRHATEAEVRRWFSEHPDANIGVVTGAVSGIIAVDVDGEEGELALTSRVAALPVTLTNRSGRVGGFHLIYAHPGQPIKTRAQILPSVDVRGDGGYIVVSPSVHPTGAEYTWANADVAPQKVPDVLRELIGSLAADESLEPERGTRVSARVSTDEWTRPIVEGTRNMTLTRLAGSMASAGADADSIFDRLLEVNQRWCTPPLVELEVAQIANSIHAREARVSSTGRNRLIRQDLHTVESEAVTWLWENYIPLGAISVIDGNPGVGKSTLTIDLASRITTGRTMPDGTPGAEGHVVLVNIEDDIAKTVKPRVIAAGGDPEKITVLREVELHDGKTRPFRLPDDAGLIVEEMKRNGAKLVVIDPLMAFLSAKVNAYSDQHVRAALNPLALAAQELDAAVVIVRHPTKNRDRSAMEAGGGSIGIIGTARAGYYVAQSPENDLDIIFASTKANLARKPTSLCFRLDDGRNGHPVIRWTGPSTVTAEALRPQPTQRPRPISRAADFLVDMLQDGPRPQPELEAAAVAEGLTWSTVKRAKKQLGVETAKVAFDGGWSWRLGQGAKGDVTVGLERDQGLESNGPELSAFADSPAEVAKKINSPLRDTHRRSSNWYIRRVGRRNTAGR